MQSEANYNCSAKQHVCNVKMAMQQNQTLKIDKEGTINGC